MAKFKQSTFRVLAIVAVTSLGFGLYASVFLASSRANSAQQSLSGAFHTEAIALVASLLDRPSAYEELLGAQSGGQDIQEALQDFFRFAPLIWFNASDTPVTRLASAYKTWEALVAGNKLAPESRQNREAATMELASAYLDAARLLNRAGERIRVAFDLTFLFLGFFLSLSAAASVWILARLRESQLKENLSHEAFVRTLQVEEATRKAVALELHDDLAQDIAAAKMLCERSIISSQNELQARAAAILAGVNKKIRLISSELRPPELDTLGLRAALQAICAEAAQRFDFILRYEGPTQIQRLGEETELGIYRIMREATSNAAKYATSATGTLSCAIHTDDRGQLCLLVQLHDDGHAPDPARSAIPCEQSVRGSRLGVQAMSERAKAIGASLTVDLQPEGSTVTLELRINGKTETPPTRSNP
ncbi:MAG TPA: histidine kinase [Spirochaetales bacterium]|nr:histidine kinase [Spirochaetales bacterium]